MTLSQRAVRWLQPGLVVKRWLLTSGLGLLMALLGAAVWADLKPIYWMLETLSWLLSNLTTVLPREITGPLVLLIGIGLLLWVQSRSFGSIQQALAPDKDTVLVDALRAQSRLNRGPNIVAIGGGTGLSTLLSGLKRYSSRITAIVTVADDGGSSGVLRRELGVLPPGDIRNCLAALLPKSHCSPACSNTALLLGAAWKGTASAICFSQPCQRSRAIWKQRLPHPVVCLQCKARSYQPPTWMYGSGPNLKTANESKAKATLATPPAPSFASVVVLNDLQPCLVHSKQSPMPT